MAVGDAAAFAGLAVRGAGLLALDDVEDCCLGLDRMPNVRSSRDLMRDVVAEDS